MSVVGGFFFSFITINLAYVKTLKCFHIGNRSGLARLHFIFFLVFCVQRAAFMCPLS